MWSQEPPGSEDVLNSPKLAIDAFTNTYDDRQVRASAELVQDDERNDRAATARD